MAIQRVCYCSLLLAISLILELFAKLRERARIIQVSHQLQAVRSGYHMQSRGRLLGSKIAATQLRRHSFAPLNCANYDVSA